MKLYKEYEIKQCWDIFGFLRKNAKISIKLFYLSLKSLLIVQEVFQQMKPYDSNFENHQITPNAMDCIISINSKKKIKVINQSNTV